MDWITHLLLALSPVLWLPFAVGFFLGNCPICSQFATTCCPGNPDLTVTWGDMALLTTGTGAQDYGCTQPDCDALAGTAVVPFLSRTGSNCNFQCNWFETFVIPHPAIPMGCPMRIVADVTTFARTVSTIPYAANSLRVSLFENTGSGSCPCNGAAGLDAQGTTWRIDNFDCGGGAQAATLILGGAVHTGNYKDFCAPNSLSAST